MQHQYVNREFLVVILAFLATLCLFFTFETPTALVSLAGLMIIIGIWGWAHSRDLPSPWAVRLASTSMILVSIAFLIWYFYRGRTLLDPLVDTQEIFRSIHDALSTPTPEA